MAYLEGVYWDLDGTIANTELEAHLPAFNKSFKDIGIDWFWDDLTYINLLKINGGKNRIAYYAAKNKINLDKDLILKIHKRKQDFYLSFVEDGAIKLKEGVERLINELVKNNIRQFIVTSSSRIQVETLIRKLFKNHNPFEFYIASEDVSLHKPDPAPYLKAINLSGININNTVVFEDSYVGLKSSMASNLRTIIIDSNIPSKINKDQLGSNCKISSLGDKDSTSELLIGPEIGLKFVDLQFINNFLNYA